MCFCRHVYLICLFELMQFSSIICSFSCIFYIKQLQQNTTNFCFIEIIWKSFNEKDFVYNFPIVCIEHTQWLNQTNKLQKKISLICEKMIKGRHCDWDCKVEWNFLPFLLQFFKPPNWQISLANVKYKNGNSSWGAQRKRRCRLSSCVLPNPFKPSKNKKKTKIKTN